MKKTIDDILNEASFNEKEKAAFKECLSIIKKDQRADEAKDTVDEIRKVVEVVTSEWDLEALNLKITDVL